MKSYVLGFAFLPDNSCVLIENEKPDWRRGLVNGLGGKIEVNETEYDAMIREFKEECGIGTAVKHWRHGLTICHNEPGNEWEMHVFRGRLGFYPDEYIDSDEGKILICADPPDNMEQTARWLYWMCRDDSTFGLLS